MTAGQPKIDHRSGLPQRTPRTAIIDIGSNSIRLVVYSGPRRNPAIIFNEKVSAGLGKGLAETGALDAASMQRALVAMARFGRLIDHLGVDETITVATAAVRDASNGADFVAQLEETGLRVTVLSGEQEAEAAALGVICGIPDADGIIGDLGGGSLELASVAAGLVAGGASTPFGVLRVSEQDRAIALAKRMSKLIGAPAWLDAASGRDFYMVGGSWRALARLDMQLTGHPLKVLHQYVIDPARLPHLLRMLRKTDRDALRAIPDMATARIDTVGRGAELAAAVCSLIKPQRCVISAYGLREGLLFARLDAEQRSRDPLIVSAIAFGKMHSRYRQDGRALFGWVTPLWPGLSADHLRLLKAACHLSDVGWQATPDFRADRAVEIALHGSWVGIDAPGRAMLAQTLATSFGGEIRPRAEIAPLLTDDEITLAIGWGLAMRLAKRLGAGVESVVANSRIAREDGALVLALAPDDRVLAGESVERRLKKLAQHMSLSPQIAVL